MRIRGLLLVAALFFLTSHGQLITMPKFPEECQVQAEDKKCWSLMLRPEVDDCPKDVEFNEPKSKYFFTSTAKELCLNEVITQAFQFLLD